MDENSSIENGKKAFCHKSIGIVRRRYEKKIFSTGVVYEHCAFGLWRSEGKH